MLKHTLTFAVVSLLLAGCGGSESNEPETQGASPADTVHAEACKTFTQTSSTCQDYAAWKKATIATCQGMGLTASSTQPQNACDAAGTLFSAALMTCCQ